jgi:hypothetical protein
MPASRICWGVWPLRFEESKAIDGGAKEGRQTNVIGFDVR